MNAPQAKEINLWTCTDEEKEEWDRQQEEIRARIVASPKFQYGEKRSGKLIDILFSTPEPEPTASLKEIEAFRTPELLSALGARGALPESPAVFTSLIKTEKWQETNRYLQWLRLQVYFYHVDKREAVPIRDVPYGRHLLQRVEILNDFRSAFKIGSALAIYEQMDRAGIAEPSLSKTHWLLTKAPDLNGATRPGFGSPDAIAHSWKDYYHFAHYWAAYVAMTGEPFSFEPATLVKFVCKANLGRFRRLAATYLKFRRGVSPPRSKQKSYIKKGLDDYRNVEDIASAQPIPRELLPNLLNAEQWNALNDYSVRPRKERA